MKIYECLQQQGEMMLAIGATRQDILNFETNNNVLLPLKFKDWLLFSDGGELFLPAGVQIYGVSHKPLIDICDDARPDEKWIVIGRLASGDPILCENKGERIAIYNLEAECIEDDEIYGDFYDFLEALSNLLGMDE